MCLSQFLVLGFIPFMNKGPILAHRGRLGLFGHGMRGPPIQAAAGISSTVAVRRITFAGMLANNHDANWCLSQNGRQTSPVSPFRHQTGQFGYSVH